jgi:hypothetical protein
LRGSAAAAKAARNTSRSEDSFMGVRGLKGEGRAGSRADG